MSKHDVQVKDNSQMQKKMEENLQKIKALKDNDEDYEYDSKPVKKSSRVFYEVPDNHSEKNKEVTPNPYINVKKLHPPTEPDTCDSCAEACGKFALICIGLLVAFVFLIIILCASM